MRARAISRRLHAADEDLAIFVKSLSSPAALCANAVIADDFATLPSVQINRMR
jgi:hypothetical protein